MYVPSRCSDCCSSAAFLAWCLMVNRHNGHVSLVLIDKSVKLVEPSARSSCRAKYPDQAIQFSSRTLARVDLAQGIFLRRLLFAHSRSSAFFAPSDFKITTCSIHCAPCPKKSFLVTLASEEFHPVTVLFLKPTPVLGPRNLHPG